ncbi:MAG: substrate-binding domain-containing protein [Chloroflexi bacterium]|nr:substrate-binding domain-containing protein [Chloroflexota bacterium]
MLTRHSSLVTLFVALLVSLSACAPTPEVTRTPSRLRLGDAVDEADVLNRLLETYGQNHEWVSFVNDPLSTNEAIDRVRNDHLDLAILPLSPEQLGIRLWTSGLAYDSLVIVVHPDNPVTNLTLIELRDIFQGRTFDWSLFGGVAEVIPVSRETGSIARQLFEERVMNGRAVTQNAVLKSSARDVVNYVAATPGTIGYAPISQLNDRVKVISLESVMPNPTTATNGQYVLSSPLYLIARVEPQGDLREFVGWLLGDEGQKMLSEFGLGRVR